MKAGRKRSFDKEEALDKAMRVFWENGYAGTSLAQLTEALGINKPSLYAAFGNKEQLFATAMEHYVERYAARNIERLTQPPGATLRQRLSAYLAGVIDTITDSECPKGCMYVKSSCESGSVAVPDEIQASIDEMGLATEQALAGMLEAEQQSGELPADVRVQDIVGYILSVTYGLSVLARRGKTKKELITVAEMAIGSLPGV